MVGTFYAAPAPGEPAFVKVGDEVAAGETLCIVEAMKLMNEIGAPQMGIVREICRTAGISALVIIHDLNLALRFCDRFLMMRGGEICEYGDSSVLNRDSIGRVYRIRADIAEMGGRKVVLVD